MVFRRAAHAAYDTAYHLVWSPKYRKHILEGALAVRVEQMFKEIADSYDITIDEVEVSPDHVHLFCSFPPRYSIAQVVFPRGPYSASSRRSSVGCGAGSSGKTVTSPGR